MDLQVTQDERRGSFFDGGKELHNSVVLAADCDTQPDPTIGASVFRRECLGAADRGSGGRRQLSDTALQIGRSDRITGAIEGDPAGARRGPQFGDASL